MFMKIILHLMKLNKYLFIYLFIYISSIIPYIFYKMYIDGQIIYRKIHFDGIQIFYARHLISYMQSYAT